MYHYSDDVRDGNQYPPRIPSCLKFKISIGRNTRWGIPYLTANSSHTIPEAGDRSRVDYGNESFQKILLIMFNDLSYGGIILDAQLNCPQQS